VRLIKESHVIEQKALVVAGFNEDLVRWKKRIESFIGRYETMQINQNAPPRVTLWEEAVVYGGERKRNLMMTGMAGLGTFGFVLLAFAWWEFRLRRIYSPDELVHGLGIQLVGTLPDHTVRYRSRMKAGYRSSKHRANMLVDSIDAIRTMILFADKMEGTNVIMVTSAVSGEGKTTSASHLAASLSRTERNTLLIDCDLRNSSVHRLFDMPLSPGLSELLRGECGIAHALFQTSVPNLTVMSAGQADGKALQALSKPTVSAVFDQLREEFDFIVIDSPPVLPVPDALLLAQQADAVIFSVLRDVSRFPTVYSAYQRLTNLGARILGAVVSGSRDEVYSSYYNYTISSD